MKQGRMLLHTGQHFPAHGKTCAGFVHILPHFPLLVRTPFLPFKASVSSFMLPYYYSQVRDPFEFSYPPCMLCTKA